MWGKAGGLFTQSSWPCHYQSHCNILIVTWLRGWGGSGAAAAGESYVWKIRDPALVLAPVDSSLSRRGNESNFMRLLCDGGVGGIIHCYWLI